MNNEILFGITDTHTDALTEKIRLHKEAIEPFRRMQKEAKKAGHQLEIASGFRGFEAQLNIWNKKARGERQLLDSDSRPLDFKKLSPKEIVYAILRWSALPGTSRHHWGTDFDVFDPSKMPNGYELQLIPSECEGPGLFAKLHEWLDENMGQFGFYRPYSKDRQGVSPERWHLSYGPVSVPLLQAYQLPVFETLLKEDRIALIDVVRAEKLTIFSRFLHNVEPTFLRKIS